MASRINPLQRFPEGQGKAQMGFDDGQESDPFMTGRVTAKEASGADNDTPYRARACLQVLRKRSGKQVRVAVANASGQR